MITSRSWLGGLGLGAVLMYLMDPDRGRRRRALARDWVVGRTADSERFLEKSTRDTGNRARGVVARMRGRLRAEGPVDDEVLAERVRSVIGRHVSHPGAIEVFARDGRVTLGGPVLAQEANGLLAAARSVRGVRALEDRLELHRDPEGVPALQGDGRRSGTAPEYLQEHWSPAARIAAGTAGGALALAGLRRSGKLGGVVGAVGAGLLARSVTNLPTRRLTGIGAGRRAVEYRKSITVRATPEEVYELWGRGENFPRFMAHVEEVRDLGGDRTLWTAVGPGGTRVSWIAVVTDREPGRRIAWRSESGSTVENAGVVRFSPVGDGSATRVDIQLSYNPPAGFLGDVVASLFGKDPKSAMDEDLVRFQTLVEEGRTRVEGHRVTAEELRPDA